MAVVTNQKNLQISFALDDGSGRVSYMTLPIKPEELTRTEPLRVTAQQTLDGAFIDEFGRGLTTINISGNTGWGQGTRPAGDIMFLKLRDEFIHEWGKARRVCIDAGKDPNLVRLIFIDALNGPYVADVVPTQFVLRRSKSQPLLYLYTLAMTVVSEQSANPYPELLEPIEDEAKVSSSVESLGASADALTGPPSVAGAAPGAGGLIGKLDAIKDKIGSLGASVLAATKSTFGPAIAAAKEIIATANAAKRVLTEAEQAAVNVAKELSATATTMWDSVASVVGLPADAMAAVLQVKREFSNLGCVLSNGFTDAIGKATSPKLPYGSSNCSSTSYGASTSSASGSPFALTTTEQAAIQVAAAAKTAISNVIQFDYLLPKSDELIEFQLKEITSNTVVSAASTAATNSSSNTGTSSSTNYSSNVVAGPVSQPLTAQEQAELAVRYAAQDFFFANSSSPKAIGDYMTSHGISLDSMQEYVSYKADLVALSRSNGAADGDIPGLKVWSPTEIAQFNTWAQENSPAGMNGGNMPDYMVQEVLDTAARRLALGVPSSVSTPWAV